MERITISLDKELASAFDALIAERGYSSRSEAMRDLLRRELESTRLRDEAGGECVATLSYLYRHHERALAERLTRLQHAHHDLTVSTLHAHLDHDDCIECAILRGPSAAVRRFAESIMAESGVRHGSLNLIGVEVSAADHGHTHPHGHPHSTRHVHYRPRS
ncbi:nickel-responsive transcriptional regulator NikR [Thauera sp. Sel9]|uniref:nickel-responsive transcriptional regulator NikR n=1 Tax=Thauera sp. Sel9 TaxID=2974299 RepID=UPI0021E16F1C|nr:nickel-responsive transcriptional regulator NikR [Thauera sp. Sel9]MCV2219500.1 nickel-responsive transcriptional regulator NikR [Thauera sp. Sel9]